MVLAAIPLSGVTCIAKQRRDRQNMLETLKKQDAETVKQIVIDVEEVRAKLGRSPESQAELESLLGRKLPKVHDDGYPTPINYWRTDENSYRLQYELWATDDWIFDSKNPDAGWVQHFY
jgi:hypothetical protein